MPTELPLACSLDAGELEERTERWRRLADRSLIEASSPADGVAIQRHRPDDGVLTELRELISLEGECCPFLDFDLADHGDEIVLTVRGPELAASLIAAFAGEAGGAAPA